MSIGILWTPIKNATTNDTKTFTWLSNRNELFTQLHLSLKVYVKQSCWDDRRKANWLKPRLAFLNLWTFSWLVFTFFQYFESLSQCFLIFAKYEYSTKSNRIESGNCVWRILQKEKNQQLKFSNTDV